MGGDRFIPTRNSKQMDVASFLLSKENEPVDANNPGVSSVSYSDVSTFFWNAFCELRINAKTFFLKENQKAMSMSLNGYNIEDAKILHLGGKPLNAPEGKAILVLGRNIAQLQRSRSFNLLSAFLV